jgi:hypothetical protein
VLEAEARVAGTQADTLRSIAKERIFGRGDLFDMNYLELGIAVARAASRGCGSPRARARACSWDPACSSPTTT